MSTPIWHDASPEQAQDEYWGGVFGKASAPAVPRHPGIKPIWLIAGLGLAALFGYAKSRPACPHRREPKADTVHQEYEEALRGHLEAMRRVQKRADKSAADANRELRELARVYRESDRGG